MCGLCGLFGSDDHWTATQPGHVAASADPVQRRKSRQELASAVNTLLAARRITVRDWQGQNFVLTGPTGHQVIVDTISDIWAALETGLGGVFDPLSVENIEGRRRPEGAAT
ncbi:hypothetical protein [Roseibium sp. SCP14]|uniref:hypothetical protein n=1 Tax=Roseibium sp. SCP14 TaxID=3141375 RepID=UPI0033352998